MLLLNSLYLLLYPLCSSTLKNKNHHEIEREDSDTIIPLTEIDDDETQESENGEGEVKPIEIKGGLRGKVREWQAKYMSKAAWGFVVVGLLWYVSIFFFFFPPFTDVFLCTVRHG